MKRRGDRLGARGGVVEMATVAGFEVVHAIADEEAAAMIPGAGISQITAVLQGAITQPSRPDVAVAAGRLMYNPTGDLQALDVSPRTSTLIIRPDPERLQTLEPFFPQPWQLTYLELHDFDDLPQRVVHALLRHPIARSLALEGAVLSMIAAGAEIQRRANLPPPSRLRIAIEFIRANLDQPIGLSEVAAAVRMSRSALAEAFQRERRTTVGGFIRKERLRAACQRLRDTTASLSEIAHACGFYDQSHMARVFREEMNTPPWKYREAWRDSGEK